MYSPIDHFRPLRSASLCETTHACTFSNIERKEPSGTHSTDRPHHIFSQYFVACPLRHGQNQSNPAAKAKHRSLGTNQSPSVVALVTYFALFKPWDDIVLIHPVTADHPATVGQAVVRSRAGGNDAHREGKPPRPALVPDMCGCTYRCAVYGEGLSSWHLSAK